MPNDPASPRPPHPPEQVVVDLRSAEPPSGAGLIEFQTHDVDILIQELFSVGLTLAGCVPSVDSAVADRLTMAIDTLDDVIAHVQLAAFGRRERPGLSTAAADPANENLKTMLSLLNRAARNASRLVEVAIAQRRDPSQFIEAAQSIYRAMITLTHQHGEAVRMDHERELGGSSRRQG